MKLAAMALVILGAIPTLASAAITCSATALSTITTSPQSPAATGNTCTDTGASNVQSACGTSLNGAGASVFGLQLGTNYSSVQLTLASTGSGTSGACAGTSTCQFWPGIYLLNITAGNKNNGCGTQPCPNNGTVQQNDTTNAVLAVPAGLTVPQTFYFVVGDANGVGADGQCGPYSVAVSGTLPVKLEKFSVD